VTDEDELKGEELKAAAETLKESAKKVEEVADDLIADLPDSPSEEGSAGPGDAATIDRNTDPEPGGGGPH
jgi:hypothetical protein